MNNQNLTKRQIKALETKNKLYHSARTLFAEKGFYNVSVDEIVKLAGTSKGSFYTYYKSKEHVIIEHYKQFDDFYLKFYEEMDQTKASAENIMDFAVSLFTYVKEEIGFEMTYVVYDTQLRHKNEMTFIKDSERPLYQVLDKIIKKGMENGELRTDIPCEDLVLLTCRTFRGVFYDWCLYKQTLDLVEMGTLNFKVFIDGIRK
ncbi:TetR/AcrR family transcriptional regulator [Acidaminobacter sp. JC074]|uniref:TetR/AcrR family transcriptional regulator n=1 Tax=Acidaminobacter sp. JC074 TaxID=2530199 RepID=UPI001F0D46DF|nr:TetR/AcrR family transcriptional regulator [Acidaminobacter sp. JC074]MCH4886951.1 TetR/AcrR family transcriptional regulator [Acidaminobacter sp. JC074]